MTSPIFRLSEREEILHLIKFSVRQLQIISNGTKRTRCLQREKVGAVGGKKIKRQGNALALCINNDMIMINND